MKKVSNHLGEIIVALACVALLISAITLFDAPISSFFTGTTDKLVALGNTLVDGIDTDPDIGVSGGESGGGAENGGGAGGAAAPVPNNVTSFYTFTPTSTETGYKVGLNSDFRAALNGNTDYVVDGETLWTMESALPNPGSTYNGLPVENMVSMFAACSNLTSLDLSNFDTSNVTLMGYMFQGCTQLASLDLSNFDTSNVTSMPGIFDGCFKLKSVIVRNEADKTKFEGLPSKPSGITFTIK